MTVSFDKFGDFFPGTGHIRDVGAAAGKHYSLNVPLNDGIDDESFRGLFRPIMQKVMDVYQPDAAVLQCGADSLTGDRLGCFNLSVKGHADCLRFLRSFNVPLMVLGGGGYTIRNVARCWCYETAVAVGVEPDNKLPYNEYYEYFGPDYNLHIEPSNMEDLNSPRDLERIRCGFDLINGSTRFRLVKFSTLLCVDLERRKQVSTTESVANISRRFYASKTKFWRKKWVFQKRRHKYFDIKTVDICTHVDALYCRERTDAEMAFLMANQALSAPGKLVYDPFVGTGSIFVGATRFGAMTMGADIDIRVVRDGRGPNCNVWRNFKQYGLPDPIALLRADNNLPPWRPGLKEVIQNPVGDHRTHSVSPLEVFQQLQRLSHEEQLNQFERNIQLHDRLQRGVYDSSKFPFEQSMSMGSTGHGSA